MKHTTALMTFTFSAFFLALPSSVSAETTVNVTNDTGGNTVCINGKCTTTEGTSKSKVCVNGQCWDSSNENVDYQSPDGKTKVKITNDKSTTTVQQNSTGTSNTTVNVTNEGSKEVKDIEPTIKQEVKATQDKIEAKKAEAQKKIEEATKGFDFMAFIQSELDEIKSFFTLEFLFGKKEQ